jgi:KH/beta-lactamase-domain protein
MGIDDFIHHAREVVRSTVPATVQITNIEFEGPMVVIYTKSLEQFANNNDIVRQLAQALRRRVAVRPDPSILADTDRAETEIKHIIPPEAEVSDIWFDGDTGEVTIEALQPGMAIGKHGTILNDIKKRIGWAPKVVRTPPIPSKTVAEIRGYLRMVSEDRKEWLKKVARKINRETSKGENWVRISALGGYREVGRSAHLLTTKDSKVLIDCGVKFAQGDEDSPFLNAPEFLPIESIDAVIITHAHLDHCGLVPLLFKYGYDGAVYCTPPTRDMMSLLQIDYMKVAYGEGRRSPFDSAFVREMVKHTITLNYGDTTDISPDVRLTLQNAGHILGSSIAHFHIGDGIHNIAISGDMKYEKTWLFNPAMDKFPRLETLVMESTYGGFHDHQPSRKEAAEALRSIVSRTIDRGGKVLIPVFAVGRSQEVMIVLEQYMRQKELKEVPVHLDGMIWEATAIHTAYPEYLNSNLRNQIFQKGENPFLSPIFKRVESADMRERICNDPEPCIVLATSGMLNGGPVMEYFKNWCTEPNHSLVFVGYQAEGTLGRRIQRGWKDIQFTERGGKTLTLPIKLGIDTVDGFSGHSDRNQLMGYVQNIQPKPERILVMHGEEAKCLDLAVSLHKRFGVETRAPPNLEVVRLR